MVEYVKPDCSKCVFCGYVTGSTHASCHHPIAEHAKAAVGPLGDVLAVFASVKRVSPIFLGILSGELRIVGDSHGIEKGWFNWPYNFDPTWLKNCEGFKERIHDAP